MFSPITVLAFDIDGVLTDGRLALGDGSEGFKRICFRDLDAITQAKAAGYTVALVTGEQGPTVDRLAQRIGANTVLTGIKDKAAGLKKLVQTLNVTPAQICYVGDSERDAAAFDFVGLSCAPADASGPALAKASIRLRSRGGEGVADEVVQLVAEEKALAVDESIRVQEIGRILKESIAAHELLLETSVNHLSSIAGTFTSVLRRGHKILLCGNGGSAADAQHVAAEIVGRFKLESDPWPAIALTTNTSVITAVANDWDYEEVFARQVRALGRPGDVLAGISTSGRSRNVLRALATARQMNIATIGFTGNQPGDMARVSDICFAAPSGSTPRIQELHLVAWHAICELVEQKMSRITNP